MGSVQQWTLVERCDVQRVLQQRIDTGSLTFLLQSVAATFFRFVLRMSVRGLGFLIGSLQSMQYSMMETIYVHVGPVLMFAMVLVWHDACVREKGLTRITAPTTSSSHGIQNCVIYSTLANRIVSIWSQLQDKHRPCAMLVLLWISLLLDLVVRTTLSQFCNTVQLNAQLWWRAVLNIFHGVIQCAKLNQRTVFY